MKKLIAALAMICCGSALADSRPVEMVTQHLEPTGGKILRPKDWHYAEYHRGPTYVWTLTREDTRGDQPYETGVKINTFVGIEKATGKTARQYLLDFVARRKAEAKVIATCEESRHEQFTTICLETEEDRFRVRYSLFWGNDGMDVAVVAIAGTTIEQWSTHVETFDRMSAFEIIDLKRFAKSPETPSPRLIGANSYR